MSHHSDCTLGTLDMGDSRLVPYVLTGVFDLDMVWLVGLIHKLHVPSSSHCLCFFGIKISCPYVCSFDRFAPQIPVTGSVALCDGAIHLFMAFSEWYPTRDLFDTAMEDVPAGGLNPH